MSNEERLVDKIFNSIKESKFKFVSLEDIPKMVKSIIGDAYTSELGVSIKDELKNHSGLDFFREGEYINQSKFHYCTGNWFAIKDIYKNPVQAKDKMGWYAWQEKEDIDWDLLD